MRRNRTDRFRSWPEAALAAIGIGCWLWAGSSSLSAIAFQVKHAVALSRPARALAAAVPDTTNGATPVTRSTALGRLEIPRIGLSVVVAEGDDEDTLDVAVGHLPDTPFPWQGGNSALAGHRDTFFRPLRRIQVGDEIRFAAPQGAFRYRVTRYMVVDPNDLSVLAASPTAALTLITCYPFDFVGSAPRRFVVQAERLNPTAIPKNLG